VGHDELVPVAEVVVVRALRLMTEKAAFLKKKQDRQGFEINYIKRKIARDPVRREILEKRHQTTLNIDDSSRNSESEWVY
jgi:hypothetical protein